MLDLYTAATPNGKKVPILLAELELPHELHLIDFKKKEQKSPEYLALNPNGKIPALVDRDGGKRIVVFESGAILLYLAERAGKLIPKDAAGRAEVLSWLFWQVGGPGPMFGQAGAFGRAQPRNEEAYAKFLEESKRLAGVLDGHLKGREWIAGGAYSIADIASYPWFEGISKAEPAIVEGRNEVVAWMGRMAARPAVQKGMRLGQDA
ncbi:MAG: gst [Labilithrix sp.]|nr:gst [Labilithrix sp.]